MKGAGLPFMEPAFLWLLAGLIPVLGLLLAWSERRRREGLRLLVQARLVPALIPGLRPWRRRLKQGLMLAAVAWVLLGMARPWWGYVEEESRGSGVDVVVCMDVSRSMLATDLKPTRIQRAKLAAFDLARLAKGDRVALVAFAGTAFLQCPLALDPEAFRQSVTALDTEVIPEAGTTLSEALKEARRAFAEDSGASRAIVVITDGEDHEPGAVKEAEAARKEGIRVYTVGAGSAEGDVLRTADPYGNPVFVRDEQGNPVRSRLNEGLLRQVAEAGNGFYVTLRDAQAMRTLYDRGIGTLPKGEFAGGRVRQPRERFQWPLALALGLLLMEMAFPEEWRPRRGAAGVAKRAGLGQESGGKRGERSAS